MAIGSSSNSRLGLYGLGPIWSTGRSRTADAGVIVPGVDPNLNCAPDEGSVLFISITSDSAKHWHSKVARSPFHGGPRSPRPPTTAGGVCDEISDIAQECLD